MNISRSGPLNVVFYHFIQVYDIESRSFSYQLHFLSLLYVKLNDVLFLQSWQLVVIYNDKTKVPIMTAQMTLLNIFSSFFRENKTGYFK